MTIRKYDFIDKYMLCSIPRKKGKLKEQVLLLQQQKHSSYCNRPSALGGVIGRCGLPSAIVVYNMVICAIVGCGNCSNRDKGKDSIGFLKLSNTRETKLNL